MNQLQSCISGDGDGHGGIVEICIRYACPKQRKRKKKNVLKSTQITVAAERKAFARHAAAEKKTCMISVS